MMFLLVVLLTNYGDASRTSRAFLLQSSIKQQLGSSDFLLIKRYLPALGGSGESSLGFVLHSLSHRRFLGAHVELGTHSSERVLFVSVVLLLPWRAEGPLGIERFNLSDV